MSNTAVTMVVAYTHSGRVAVMARRKPGDAWQQVDSCADLAEANGYAAKIATRDALRSDVLAEWGTEVWGQDAPIAPPTE